MGSTTLITFPIFETVCKLLSDDIIINQNGEVPTQPLGTQQSCSSS